MLRQASVFGWIAVVVCFFLGHQSYGQSFEICQALSEKANGGWHQGVDGWAFLDQELQVDYTPSSVALANLRTFAEALRSQGVELVLLPTPSRSLLSDAYLDTTDPQQMLFDVEQARASFISMVNQLEQQTGIPVVNVLTPMLESPEYSSGEPLYFKRNNHWRSAGVKIAADALTSLIRTRLATTYNQLSKQSYQLKSKGISQASTIFAQNLKTKCKADVPFEEYELFEAVSQDVNVGLFDAAEPEVVLVGTSFTGSQHNFDAFLAVALSADVLNMAVPGGYLFTSMQDYLLNEAYTQHKPKIIVWEIEPRYLTGGNLITPAEQLAGFRQLTASVYGDCQGAEVYSHSLNLELATTMSAGSNLLTASLDTWEKGPNITVAADALDANIQGTAYKVTVEEKPRFLRFRTDVGKPLSDTLLIYSAWLWSEEFAQNLTVSLFDIPDTSQSLEFSITLTDEPTLYQIPVKFAATSKKRLGLRLSTTKNGVFYVAEPRLVAGEVTDVMLVPPNVLPPFRDFYAVLEIADPSLSTFNITSQLSIGSTEVITIERSTRLANSGKFMLELPEGTDSVFLTSVFHEAQLPLEVTTRICQKP
jgi:hypothetical protein